MNEPPRRGPPRVQIPESRDRPPFIKGNVVEVLKTGGSPFKSAQRLRVDGLWWGEQTGHWMINCSDISTGKAYITFADTVQLYEPTKSTSE